MKRFFVILFILLNAVAFGTNYYSIGNGNWNDSTMWSLTSGGAPCGCFPNANPSGDNIHIETDINLNQNLSMKTGGSLTITSTGNLHTITYSLVLQSNSTLDVIGTLEVNNLDFNNNSIIIIENGSTVIVHGNLTNANNSNNVTINGDISVAGTFDNGQGGIVAGSGNITASTFTGNGTTFDFNPTTSIPPGSTVSTGSLPIELLTFYGQCENGANVITWATASETNIQYFILHSVDFIFQGANIIDTVVPHGPFVSYSAIDYYPIGEMYTYYYLSEIDYNGNENVVSSNISVENCNTTSINIFPNPVQHNNDFYIVGSVSEIKIYDIIGKEVPFKLKKDNTIQGLSSGLYIIIVNGIRTFKLIVN